MILGGTAAVCMPTSISGRSTPSVLHEATMAATSSAAPPKAVMRAVPNRFAFARAL
jgi:hypothetical protein